MSAEEKKDDQETLCYGPNEKSFCTLHKSKLKAPELLLINITNPRL